MVPDEDNTRTAIKNAAAAEGIELLEEGFSRLMQSAFRCECREEPFRCGASECRQLVFAFHTAVQCVAVQGAERAVTTLPTLQEYLDHRGELSAVERAFVFRLESATKRRDLLADR